MDQVEANQMLCEGYNGALPFPLLSEMDIIKTIYHQNSKNIRQYKNENVMHYYCLPVFALRCKVYLIVWLLMCLFHS